MTEYKGWEPGGFCWFELATTDTPSAKKFYDDLFGWTADEVPLGARPTTVVKAQGRDVAAINPLLSVEKAAGVRPHWQVYVSVESADQSARKAVDLGGKVRVGPMDVAQAGRMALIEDPTGARVALWQAKKHIGAAVTNEPGTPCWCELQSRNLEAARAFYGGLFGWSTTTSTEPTPYTELIHNGISIGGMLTIDPRWGDVSPNWALYFNVDDCATVARKVITFGGKVQVPPMQIGKTMRFATFADPQGASFSVLAM